MNKILVSTLLSFILGASCASAKRLMPERVYQDAWCKGKGATEVVMSDRTRIDCLTSTHAVEMDFADKWAESIGQSLGYAVMSGRRAGVALIVEKPSHKAKWNKLNTVIKEMNLPIDTWMIEPK